jgi:hypothetical protein
MPWSESNASRRQLLGQLSGQFADLAKARAARRGQTQDILAGFGQTALGYLGEKGLETQRQGGRLELAGAESGYRTAEEAERQRLMGEREMNLQGRSAADAIELAKAQEMAKTDEDIRLWRESGLPAEVYFRGFRPVESGKKELSDMEKALADPFSWATGMLYTYKDDRNLLENLPPGQALPPALEDDFRTYGKDFVDLQFPEMSQLDKNRLKAAIDKVISRPIGEPPGDVGGGSNAELEAIRQRRIKENDLVGKLKTMLGTLGDYDPLREKIQPIIAEAELGNVGLRRDVVRSEEAFNDWVNRAEQILRPSILEEKRRGTNVPETGSLFQRFRATIENLLGK